MNDTLSKAPFNGLCNGPSLALRLACGLLVASTMALPAAAQSLPTSISGIESRLSPAQMQKAERMIQKAESGGLTAAQTAKLRELEKRPGAGQARAQGEKLLAERRQQQANATTKVGAGDASRRVQDPIAGGSGLRSKPAATGGTYTPGASPLGGGLPSSGSSSFGASPSWAKGR